MFLIQTSRPSGQKGFGPGRPADRPAGREHIGQGGIDLGTLFSDREISEFPYKTVDFGEFVFTRFYVKTKSLKKGL